jgi:carbamoyl-phosphate synthase/aspartate carbamoyltransferase
LLFNDVVIVPFADCCCLPQVDFAIPLVTNVKCAKLFIEALARRPALDISNVDYKTSHRAVILPGLVDTQAFAPGIAMPGGSADVAKATQAALRSGFTMVQFIPSVPSAGIEDATSLQVARNNAARSAAIDYAFAVAATPQNSTLFSDEVLSGGARSLFIPFNRLTGADVNKIAAVSTHFGAWPTDKPIVTDAKNTDLASILLLASLHNRGIHVTGVTSKGDIQLIALSKEKSLRVTCDVSVYCLFLSQDDFPNVTCLPTAEDQQALWEHLDVVDTFSIGTVPYQLAQETGNTWAPGAGIEEGLHLLLSAVNEGRLELEDVTKRLYDTPRSIFGLPEQDDTYVEVEIDRRTTLSPPSDYWSPVANRTFYGSIHRLVFQGQTVLLDGKILSKVTLGEDISSDIGPMPMTKRKLTREGRFSFTATRPSLSSLALPHSMATISTQTADQLRSPTVGPQSASALGRSPPSTHAARSPPLKGVEPALQPSLMSLSAPQAAAPQPPTPLPTLSSFVSDPAFFRRHILSVRQFTRNDLHALFNIAHEMRVQVERGAAIDVLRGRVLCTLFYEPSTRTSASFEAAISRLGGRAVAVSADRSSVTKGETLADTVRTLGCYADAIVLRHPAPGSAQLASKYSPVPIINAGDGIGEHPTQVGFFLLADGDGYVGLDADEAIF